MNTKFTADDLNLITNTLAIHPEVLETLNIVKSVTSKAKFPINSYDDLAETLGGEDIAITFRGRQMTLREIKKLVPAYYFPISSEKDLIAKVRDLQTVTNKATPFPVSPVTEGVDVKWSSISIAVPASAPSVAHLTSQLIFESVKDVKGPSGVGRLN